jgi:hypothetical protein
MTRVVMPRVTISGGYVSRRAVEAGVTLDQLATSEPPKIERAVVDDLAAMLRRAASEIETANARATEAIAATSIERTAREAAESKAIELRGSTDAWAALASPAGDFSVGDAAKMVSRNTGLALTRSGLFSWLLLRGMIYMAADDRSPATRTKHYRPAASEIKIGRLALRVGGPWVNPKTGEDEPGRPQVRVTPKGLVYITTQLLAASTPERAPTIAPQLPAAPELAPPISISRIGSSTTPEQTDATVLLGGLVRTHASITATPEQDEIARLREALGNIAADRAMSAASYARNVLEGGRP